MNERIDELRLNALARARRAELRFRAAVLGLLLVEGVFVMAYVLTANLRDPLHRLILFAAGIVYMPLVFGLIALGAHINRCTWRIIAALDRGEDSSASLSRPA